MKWRQETVKACSIMVIWSKGIEDVSAEQHATSKILQTLFSLQTTASLWSVKINMTAMYNQSRYFYVYNTLCFKAQQKQNFLYCEMSNLFIYLVPVMRQHVWLLSPQD